MKNAKLSLKQILSLVDKGDRSAWDSFTDEERDSVNFWILNRYISSVSGSREKQENAIIKTNEIYNKNFYDIKIGKTDGHKKLMWHLLCMCGDTGRNEFHPWISASKKADTKQSKAVELVKTVFPNMKLDEVELYVRLATNEQLRALAEDNCIDGFKP